MTHNHQINALDHIKPSNSVGLLSPTNNDAQLKNQLLNPRNSLANQTLTDLKFLEAMDIALQFQNAVIFLYFDLFIIGH